METVATGIVTCDDGVDNDGLVDLADAQCAGFAANAGEAPSGCGLGPELAAPLLALLARRRRRALGSARAELA